MKVKKECKQDFKKKNMYKGQTWESKQKKNKEK